MTLVICPCCKSGFEAKIDRNNYASNWLPEILGSSVT